MNPILISAAASVSTDLIHSLTNVLKPASTEPAAASNDDFTKLLDRVIASNAASAARTLSIAGIQSRMELDAELLHLTTQLLQSSDLEPCLASGADKITLQFAQDGSISRVTGDGTTQPIVVSDATRELASQLHAVRSAAVRLDATLNAPFSVNSPVNLTVTPDGTADAVWN